MSKRVVIDASAPAWAHDLQRQINDVLATQSAPGYAVTKLPPAVKPGQIVFVKDATGGPVTAFSDGTTWRRTTDQSEVD